MAGLSTFWASAHQIQIDMNRLVLETGIGVNVVPVGDAPAIAVQVVRVNLTRIQDAIDAQTHPVSLPPGLHGPRR